MADPNAQALQTSSLLYSPEMLKLQGQIHRLMLRETDFNTLENMSREQLKEHIRRYANQVLSERDMTLPARTLDQLLECVIYEVTGFGPLEVLLSDDSITEIMVNGPDQIMIERAGKISRAVIGFAELGPHHAHCREDHRAAGPTAGRGGADGGRAPPGRLARECHHPTTGGQRALRDDP